MNAVTLAIDNHSTGLPTRHRVELYNFVDGQWVMVDERIAGPADEAVYIEVTTTPRRFIAPTRYTRAMFASASFLGIEAELLLQVAAAIVVGGLIGIERELRDKAAGFRTNICICLGAAVFTIASIEIAGSSHDATRIAAGIVSGIGFLGAGAILRREDRISGLTTAATIWVVAALGMSIGASLWPIVMLGTAAMLIVLWILPLVEHRIDALQDSRIYRVVCPPTRDHFKRLEDAFRTRGLSIRSHKLMREGDSLVCVWDAVGTPSEHDTMMAFLFEDDAVKSFEV